MQVTLIQFEKLYIPPLVVLLDESRSSLFTFLPNGFTVPGTNSPNPALLSPSCLQPLSDCSTYTDLAGRMLWVNLCFGHLSEKLSSFREQSASIAHR